MNKRIGIDELKPGMLIEALDRSWLSTPFFRHKMTITSARQIAQLKASGVQTLIVRIEAEEAEEGPVIESDIPDNPAVPTQTRRPPCRR